MKGGANVKAFQVLDGLGEDAEGTFDGTLAILSSRVKAHDYIDYLVFDVERKEAFTVREVEILPTGS